MVGLAACRMEIDKTAQDGQVSGQAAGGSAGGGRDVWKVAALPRRARRDARAGSDRSGAETLARLCQGYVGGRGARGASAWREADAGRALLGPACGDAERLWGGGLGRAGWVGAEGMGRAKVAGRGAWRGCMRTERGAVAVESEKAMGGVDGERAVQEQD